MQARQFRLSDNERAAREGDRVTRLDYEIAEWNKLGYRIVFRTPTTAQLVKPKHFSGFWAAVWTLLLGFGLVFYTIYYLSKSEHVVYLLIDEEGVIHQDG